MLDSAAALGGFFFLVGIPLLFLNPLIAIVPFVLGAGPLALWAASKAWAHGAPAAQGEGGPAVPTTRDASYDPRWRG